MFDSRIKLIIWAPACPPVFPLFCLEAKSLAWTELILRYIFKMQRAWNKNGYVAKHFLKVVLKIAVGVEKPVWMYSALVEVSDQCYVWRAIWNVV